MFLETWTTTTTLEDDGSENVFASENEKKIMTQTLFPAWCAFNIFKTLSLHKLIDEMRRARFIAHDDHEKFILIWHGAGFRFVVVMKFVWRHTERKLFWVSERERGKGWNVKTCIDARRLLLLVSSLARTFYTVIAQQYINIRNTLIFRWFKNH